MNGAPHPTHTFRTRDRPRYRRARDLYSDGVAKLADSRPPPAQNHFSHIHTRRLRCSRSIRTVDMLSYFDTAGHLVRPACLEAHSQ